MSIARRCVPVLLVASLVGLTGCDLWQQARFKETRELQVAHASGTGVDVQTRNGSIQVLASEVDMVEIDAELKAITQERLDATQVLASRLDDGTLYLRVEWPEGGRKGSEGCNFVIRLPDAYGTTLVSSNGALTVSGLKGQADLRTSNGRIEVKSHEGNVKADTSNGPVKLHDVAGAAEIDTSNGSVTVHLHDAANGPVNVRTSNGSVKVVVGPAFAGELAASTSNGSVRLVGFEPGEIASKGRRSCTLQARSSVNPDLAGEASRIRSSNGSITVTRRGG
eukprot:TRINITY_DN52956_c0_g1_i1.p3 TRINITY_DN52956_c0_g1~~TRINITY_DN52956_c0_g1_i1.p3  ORF type:complete len:280 (-),score=12.22 TRINITY_DN52956_c0_g1_i1:569-1408(-)